MENQIEIRNDDYQLDYSDHQAIELISARKFIILVLITFGLYGLWWNYKAWQFIEQHEKPGISPVFRTLFGIFYLPFLFQQILKMAKEKGYGASYSPWLLFTVIVAFEILSNISIVLFLISAIEIFLFIPPFKALNYAIRHAKDIEVVEQETFNTPQIVLIVLGVIAWICFPFVFNVF